MTYDNNQQSATVETLVAEVRILTVGNRQITTSIARQLDVVNLLDMQPLGRIRIGDDIMIIGRHNGTGSLVTAKLIKNTQWRTPYITLPECESLPRVSTSYRKSTSYGYVAVRFGEDQIHLSTDSVDWRSDITGWDPNGWESFIRDEIDKFHHEMQAHRHASQMPLIVLGGLR